jgi:hypothetical protein
MAALLGVVPPARADYLPVANPTKSFWLTENDLANEGRDAVLPDDILDVAVIGSGISGCSVAYHLSLTRNLKIAMFEARDFCGGATGRNGGHLTASGLLSFPSHLQSFGSKEAIKCVELQQRCVSGLLDLIHENGWASGVDLQQGGSVFLCETSEEAQLYKTAVKEAAAAGLDVSPFRWLDSEAIEKVTTSQSVIQAHEAAEVPRFGLCGRHVTARKHTLATEVGYAALSPGSKAT